jgi:hypothetical protein
MTATVNSLKELGSFYARLEDGSFFIFDIEECEKCGAPARAVNGMNVTCNVHPMRHGLVPVPVSQIPEELVWDDDFGGATCGC